MKSVTQVPIETDAIYKIVYHHFGNDTIIGDIKELSEGWWSVAYSVKLPEKDFDIIIKLKVPNGTNTQIYEHKVMETEIRAIELINRHPIGTEIPLPELIGYDLDGSLVGRGYFITKKFTGFPLDKVRKKLSEIELGNIETQIGKMQSKLNTIKGKKFGYFIDNPDHPVSSDSWAKTFTLMTENLFKDAIRYNARLPFDPNLIRGLLRNATSVLDEVTSPSFVHWDLWLGNIFIKKENGSWKLEGIIDLERAIFGDPLTESSLRGKKKKLNLIKGYGEDIFASKNAKIRDAFYDLYLATTLLVEMYVRQYNPIWRFFYRLYGKSLWKPALNFLTHELYKN